VSRRLRLTLRRQFHQARQFHFLRRRSSRQVTLDPGKSQLGITPTPARHRNPADAPLPSNLLVLQSVGSQQHDVGALRQPYARQT